MTIGDTAAIVGVLFTFVAGVAACVKAFYSFATKAEVVAAVEKVEATIAKIEATLVRMHEENRNARHELARQLSGPILDLTKEVGELWGKLDSEKRDR